VLERAQVRLLPVVNRAADHAPVIPACCNVCRTCTTTNLIGLATGSVLAAAYGTLRLARRLAGRA
jgi:hypothetical protein